ncbi:MAG: hypothetical protein H7838_06125 [Magnetococcus sp. DMHC-8]
MARKPFGRQVVSFWCAVVLCGAVLPGGGSVAEEGGTTVATVAGESAGRRLNETERQPAEDFPVAQPDDAGPVITASVPDDAGNVPARPEGVVPPLSLVEEPLLTATPEEEVAGVPRLVLPAVVPSLADPLLAVPVPEKPAETAQQADRRMEQDQTAGAQQAGTTGVEEAPPPVVAGRQRHSELPAQPRLAALCAPRSARADNRGWRRSWPRQYALHQRVYWQRCAGCHGSLPPDVIDAMVVRNAQRLGTAGFGGYPVSPPGPWVGPWYGSGRPGNGRAGW